MKKTYLFLALTAGLLTACDPHITEDGSMSSSVISEEAVAEAFSVTQLDAAGAPAADGNYFEYKTAPATMVSIFQLDADGNEKVIGNGTSGMFQIVPKRGNSPEQTYYVRVMNQDGSATIIEKKANVFVPSELSLEMKLIASNSGQKVWKWDTGAPDGQFWGNMGYAGGAPDWSKVTEGKWWGVTSTAEFADQQAHRGGDKVTGDDNTNAYMVFDEDGNINTYNATGDLIRKGKFSLDMSTANDWKMGDLYTDAGSILWPYEINSGGGMPTKFDLCLLSIDKMVLVYPDGGAFDALGGWGEATFWRFSSNSDVEGILTNYSDEGSKWTWDTEAPDGQFWGNMGYAGGAPDWSAVTEGKWWGVTSTAEFAEQQAHRGGDKVTGDDDTDAYMIITGDMIRSYDKSGKEIRKGAYSYDFTTANDWKMGDLYTDAGAILWPYEINSNGNMPTKFDLVYLSASKMALVYPDGGAFDALGGWGEASFWRFKKIK